ncbi:hypothetical protein F5Y16DRAFT_404579 [Xylariaceae sp. FL0255]|nr:hypothetical protein F5Y16DRAFT_404579 [Xylariaceae sp. FL0255]
MPSAVVVAWRGHIPKLILFWFFVVAMSQVVGPFKIANVLGIVKIPGIDTIFVFATILRPTAGVIGPFGTSLALLREIQAGFIGRATCSACGFRLPKSS